MGPFKIKRISGFRRGVISRIKSVFSFVVLLRLNSIICFSENNESVLNGVIERFYENGQLMEKITIIDNKFDGAFEEYYENGKLKAKGSYIEDRFDEPAEVGIIETYDSTGTLLRKLDCTFDEEKGFSTCKTIWAKE